MCHFNHLRQLRLPWRRGQIAHTRRGACTRARLAPRTAPMTGLVLLFALARDAQVGLVLLLMLSPAISIAGAATLVTLVGPW